MPAWPRFTIAWALSIRWEYYGIADWHRLSQSSTATGYCLLGVGQGEEAALAVEKGACVTAIDLSRAMLARARRCLEEADIAGKAELIHGNILDHPRMESYDWVIANFFLNVFDNDSMPRVLKHLSSLLREGGCLVISDFRPLFGNQLHRSLQWSYHELALRVFSLFTGNALHPIYDYRRYLEPSGLILQRAELFPFFQGGPAWFESLTLHKAPASP